MREIRPRDDAPLGARGQLIAEQRIEEVEVREFALSGTLEMVVEPISSRCKFERFELAANAMEQQFGHMAT